MLRIWLTLATLLATLGSAHARPGRNHDEDRFFMRLSAGFGFNNASFDDAANTTLSGGGGLGSFAFGATIARNLALTIDLFGLSMTEPHVEQNGRDLGDADGTTATLGAIGLGVTYYLMPANLYFAASIGAAAGTLEVETRVAGVRVRAKDNSDLGFGLNLMFGKEWWVSRRWGIGLALQAIYATAEAGVDVRGDLVSVRTLDVFGIGVLFSASLN